MDGRADFLRKSLPAFCKRAMPRLCVGMRGELDKRLTEKWRAEKQEAAFWLYLSAPIFLSKRWPA
jgi:hypothetical protein